MSTITDPLTADLPRALAVESGYALVRHPEHGLQIYLRYTDDDGSKRSMLVRDDVWHAEDFSTHVDDLEEEARIMRAEFP